MHSTQLGIAAHQTPLPPRTPTVQQLRARVHSAIATWTVPEIDDGGRVYWAIAIDDLDQGERCYVHSSASPQPMPRILGDMRWYLEGSDDDQWVIVPKRQRAMARLLQERGFSVTWGLNRGNRAAERVLELLEITKAEQIRRAMQLGRWTAGATQPPKQRPDWCPASSEAEMLWQPELYDVEFHETEILHVAVDASMDPSGAGATAAVTDRGDVVLYTGKSTMAVPNLEFEAIIVALDLALEQPIGGLRIYSDCYPALRLAEDLAQGLTPDTGRAGIADEARARFGHALDAVRHLDVHFRFVLGHNGHPLNEAADRIAAAGRLASKVHRDDSENVLFAQIAEIRRSELSKWNQHHADVDDRYQVFVA